MKIVKSKLTYVMEMEIADEDELKIVVKNLDSPDKAKEIYKNAIDNAIFAEDGRYEKSNLYDFEAEIVEVE